MVLGGEARAGWGVAVKDAGGDLGRGLMMKH